MVARASSGLLRAFVDADCPNCGYGIEFELIDALCQVWRWCPCCRVRFRLAEPTGEVSVALADVDVAVDSFIKQLSRAFE